MKNNKPDPKKEIKKVDETEEPETAAPPEDLDPEVLEALNVKKKPKSKPAHEIDYVPELERDDSED